MLSSSRRALVVRGKERHERLRPSSSTTGTRKAAPHLAWELLLGMCEDKRPFGYVVFIAAIRTSLGGKQVDADHASIACYYFSRVVTHPFYGMALYTHRQIIEQFYEILLSRKYQTDVKGSGVVDVWPWDSKLLCLCFGLRRARTSPTSPKAFKQWTATCWHWTLINGNCNKSETGDMK